MTKTDVSAGQLATMRLLILLNNPDTSDSSLDAAFQSDIALCYQLLRIVNAAAVGGHSITSIPHAVRLVGRETLHRWLAVLLVASLGREGDVTHELALTAITRARMCEVLASSTRDRARSGSAFIVGLLSLLDVLLEIPWTRFSVDSNWATKCATRCSGVAGHWAPRSSSSKRTRVRIGISHPGLRLTAPLPDEQLPDIYLGAVRWATQQMTG